jgi:hypothetical protein
VDDRAIAGCTGVEVRSGRVEIVIQRFGLASRRDDRQAGDSSGAMDDPGIEGDGDETTEDNGDGR